MMKNKMVARFNLEKLSIQPRRLGLMDPAEMSFSIGALREEIDEMSEAFDLGDLVGVVDALIDLDFFRRGILYKHGISPELYDKLFSVVYQKNMEKVVGVKRGREHYSVVDVVKCEGWVGPEDQLRELLEEHMDRGE